MANDKNPSEGNLKDNAPDGMALSDAEIAAARKDGAKDDVKETAKDTHRALTDGLLPGAVTTSKWNGYEESQPFAYLLDMAPADLTKLVTGKDSSIPENMIYGVLALERNGQNRTDYVKLLMKRLGLKADELPGGGPGYTNDTTNLTAL